MRRLVLLVAFALSFAIAIPVAWTEQNKLPVVGVLSGGARSSDASIEALRQGLRELGYLEGRTIRIEFRTGEGHVDRMPSLAEELVRLNADVIVVGNAAAAQAVKGATTTIPIVMVASDLVGTGLVTDLAHPGGQITGLSSVTTELHAKRLQLLKEAIPRLTRVAVLWNPGMAPWQTKALEELKAAASSLSIELRFVGIRTPEASDAAFSTVSRAHAQALYLLENPLFFHERKALAKLALKAHLPAMYGTRAFADEGGLMSYGVDYVDQVHRAAGYVDKILKGAKPGDLPIEQPTKFELVVNLKTAKALGITIPESILLRADEVIR